MDCILLKKNEYGFYLIQNEDLKNTIQNDPNYRKNIYLDLERTIKELPYFELPEELSSKFELEGHDLTTSKLSVFIEANPLYYDTEPFADFIEAGAIGVTTLKNDEEYLYVINPSVLKEMEYEMLDTLDPITMAALKYVGQMAAKKIAKEAFRDFMPKSFEQTVKEDLAHIKSMISDVKETTQRNRLDKYQDPYVTSLKSFFLGDFIPYLRKAKSASQETMKEYFHKLEVSIKSLDDNIVNVESKLSDSEVQSCSYFSRLAFGIYLDSAILALSLKSVQHAMAIALKVDPSKVDIIADRYETLRGNVLDFADKTIPKFKEGRLAQIEWIDKYDSPWLARDTFKVGFKDKFRSDYSSDPLQTKSINEIATQSFLDITAYKSTKMKYAMHKMRLTPLYLNRRSSVETSLDNTFASEYSPRLALLEEMIPKEELVNFSWKERISVLPA